MFDLKKYKFTSDDSEWMFEEHLDSLVDFAQSPYHLKGTFNCHLEMEDDNNKDFGRPQVFQQNALDYFIANQELVLSNIAIAILKQEYHEGGSDTATSISDALSFIKKNLSFESFNILGTENDNCSYTVFVFGNDDEHELGVITHKDRVIAISDVDTALFDWDDKIKQDKMSVTEYKLYLEEKERQIAENIANTKIANELYEKEQQELERIAKAQAKKWWQIWK